MNCNHPKNKVRKVIDLQRNQTELWCDACNKVVAMMSSFEQSVIFDEYTPTDIEIAAIESATGYTRFQPQNYENLRPKQGQKIEIGRGEGQHLAAQSIGVEWEDVEVTFSPKVIESSYWTEYKKLCKDSLQIDLCPK